MRISDWSSDVCSSDLTSADVPDEAGGVRAVVLNVAHPHNGRAESEAMTKAKDILLQGGTTPRWNRNTLVFLAAEARQLDNLKQAVRSALAWGEIVRDTARLDLTQSESALAKAKHTEALETMKTRLKEAWCYLIYPVQESAQAEITWISGKVPADRKSTRLTPVTNAHLVCRLMLEKNK